MDGRIKMVIGEAMNIGDAPNGMLSNTVAVILSNTVVVIKYVAPSGFTIFRIT